MDMRCNRGASDLQRGNACYAGRGTFRHERSANGVGRIANAGGSRARERSTSMFGKTMQVAARRSRSAAMKTVGNTFVISREAHR